MAVGTSAAMPRDRTALPHRRIHHVLGLGVSGGALAGLIYVQSVSAQIDEPMPEATVDATAEATEFTTTTTPEPASRAVPTVAALDVGTTPAPTLATQVPTTPPALVAAVTTEANTQQVAMVTMPDLIGMRVNEARRELKKLGLVMTVRDAYNDKIPIQWQRDYKVRRQTVKAGAELEKGTWVRVGARERRMRIPMGY